MKKVLMSLYILLVLTGYICAWSPIAPGVSNRGQIHEKKGQDYFLKKDYSRAIREFSLAYEFSFTVSQRNEALIGEVVSMMRIGSYEDAIAVMGKRERKKEKESEFLSLKAECLQRLGNTKQAIAIFDTLILREENKDNRTFFQIKEGLLFLSLDSLSQADKTFALVTQGLQRMGKGKTSTQEEQLRLAIYSLGYIAVRRDNYSKAEKYFWFLQNNCGLNQELAFKSSLYYALVLGIEGKGTESAEILKKPEFREMKEKYSVNGYLTYRSKNFDESLKQFQFIEKDTLLPREVLRLVEILSAECSYYEKKYSDAVQYYRKYTKMVSAIELKEPALYGLAWSYFRLGKYSNAYAVLKDILVLFPETKFLATIERLSALSLFYVGEHREAKYHFSRLLAINTQMKDEDRIYYFRGESEFYLQEFDNANTDFAIVISNFPNSRWKPHAENMMAKISFENGDYADAYKIYGKLLSKTLSSGLLDEVRLQTERCRLHLGYYDNPIQMSKSFVRKYPESPKSPDMQLEIAEYYFQLQRYWEAIREYERFLSLFQDEKRSRFVLFKLGRSYSQVGYFEKALEIFNKLVNGDDAYSESALLSMGDILFSKERYKEAIDIFKELTKRFPKSNMKDYANFVIGESYIELNMPKEARVSFENVVNSKQIFPFKEKAKLLYAKTLYLEGKGEEYLSYLDELIKVSGGTLRVQAYFLIAEYMKEVGRFKEAMDFYEQSSELFEANSLKVRALYEAGLSAEELKLPNKATDFYKKAISISREEAKKFKITERIKKIESTKEKEESKQVN